MGCGSAARLGRRRVAREKCGVASALGNEPIPKAKHLAVREKNSLCEKEILVLKKVPPCERIGLFEKSLGFEKL